MRLQDHQLIYQELLQTQQAPHHSPPQEPPPLVLLFERGRSGIFGHRPGGAEDLGPGAAGALWGLAAQPDARFVAFSDARPPRRHHGQPDERPHARHKAHGRCRRGKCNLAQATPAAGPAGCSGRRCRCQRRQWGAAWGSCGAQAAWAACERCQPALTEMPLNSPVLMRFCHSAGPVMWALVPPASTATVTGMSTTSNS